MMRKREQSVYNPHGTTIVCRHMLSKLRSAAIRLW